MALKKISEPLADKEKVWPVLKRLFHDYMKAHIFTIIIALICMIAAAGTTAVFAKLLQPIFDDVLINSKKGHIIPIALAAFFCISLRGLTTYAHVVLMNNVGQNIIAKIQNDLFTHLINADINFYQRNPTGTLITRMVSDATVARIAMSDSITGIIKSLITLLFLIIVMVMQDWKLSIYALVIFPVAVFMVALVGKRIRQISTRTQAGLSDLSDKLMQIFQGIKQVKMNNRERFEIERMAGTVDYMCKLYRKVVRTNTLTTPINDGLVGIILFALITYGGFSVLNDTLSPGGLVSFIAAFLLAYEPIKKISNLYAVFNMGLGAADRIFEVLDTKPTVENTNIDKKLNEEVASLSFKNVSFTYHDNKEPSLDDISFEAKPGQTIAFVGPSGSGKSTIVNLVPRFFDPVSGSICINNKNIKEFSIKSLREHISYVPQDAVIFDESVSYNIGYGKTGATQEEIEMAAKDAFAHDFINDLSEGYDTKLGENGSKLSGGQKQRIAIARALIKDAPIFLLDEATSALDNESEEYIQQSIEKIGKQKICLVVAHRLSTIKNADHIIVIDRGRITEQGKHDELIARKGLYNSLYNLSSNTSITG